MVLARLQVRNTRFSPRSFITSTFLSSFASTKGPFFSERPISFSPAQLFQQITEIFRIQILALLASPPNNVLIGPLVLARLVTQRRFAPRTLGPGHTNGLATLATAMRVIPRGHGCTAHRRANSQMTLTASLPKLNIAMLDITDLADGSVTLLAHHANLTGGHADLREITLLGQQLGSTTCGANKLSAPAHL